MVVTDGGDGGARPHSRGRAADRRHRRRAGADEPAHRSRGGRGAGLDHLSLRDAVGVAARRSDRFRGRETARLREIAESYRDNGISLEDAAAVTEQVAHDLGFSAERIAPFELYIQAGRDPALQAAATACFAAYDELTVTILTALGIPDPQSLAATLVAVIAGLQLRRLATGDGGQEISVAVLQLIRGAFLPAP